MWGTASPENMRLFQVVLASASPRRRWLLGQLGLPFTVIESDIDEAAFFRKGITPGEYVVTLALSKAKGVASRFKEPVLVLGADTVVVVDGTILGKPNSAEEAKEMLALLQGRSHEVYTGVALVEAVTGRELTAVERTEVTIRALSRNEIEAYVASGEPLDKAGAYAIQGLGATIVSGINGCFYNVVGLPLVRLASMLKEWGIDVLQREWGCGVGQPVSTVHAERTTD